MRLLDIVHINNLVSGLKKLSFRYKGTEFGFVRVIAFKNNHIIIESSLPGHKALPVLEFVSKIKNGYLENVNMKLYEQYLQEAELGQELLRRIKGIIKARTK